MRLTDADRLHHIIDSARKAIGLTQELQRDHLGDDEVLLLALTRLIEIIGEAARNVSSDLRDQHREVPWANMWGTRNRLVHAYDIVDLDILWDVIKIELPPLINAIEAIIAED